MLDGKKNRYGRTAARQHRTLGRARRPATTTIDIHCHIVVPAGAQLAGPTRRSWQRCRWHIFANAATKEINALQEKDRAKVMVDMDRGCSTWKPWASTSGRRAGPRRNAITALTPTIGSGPIGLSTKASRNSCRAARPLRWPWRHDDAGSGSGCRRTRDRRHKARAKGRSDPDQCQWWRAVGPEISVRSSRRRAVGSVHHVASQRLYRRAAVYRISISTTWSAIRWRQR